MTTQNMTTQDLHNSPSSQNSRPRVVVKVKPALIVLVLAVLIGCGTVVALSRSSAQKVATYGFVNPETWLFETRQGAQAKAFSPLGSSGGEGITKGAVDGGTGFRVEVNHVGASADAVFLRNALNLDLNPDRKPLRLTFEARSAGTAAATAPAAFPLTFTVRDSATLLWSERMTVGTSWKQYETALELKSSSLTHVIMAIQMGEANGALEIRNLRVLPID